MEKDNTDSNIGKYVGEYEIVSYISKGQFGKVYKAKDNKNHKLAAIKIIKKKKINKIDKLKELLNTEIMVMKKIDHPNIMSLYNYFESSNNYYLVIEYCEKGDLFHYLKSQEKNYVPEQEAIFFLKQIAIGFEELKKNKIMHRDLKLENIFLKENRIIIGDFGFSKFGNIGITNLGSPITMAPEILKKSSLYTDKADLWSIGVIYYQWLFGEYPFIGKNKKYILNDILTKISKIEFKDEIQKISEESKDLLIKIFKIDYKERISWNEFFKHPIFNVKKEDLSTIYKEVGAIQTDFRNFTNENFNQLRNNILTKNLNKKDNELEAKPIEFGIEKDNIIDLNNRIFDHYLNMINFFFKTIDFLKPLTSLKKDFGSKDKFNIIIIFIYEKSRLILKNIKTNLELKLNLFYLDFFEEYIKDEKYKKLIEVFGKYEINCHNSLLNFKQEITMTDKILNEISIIKEDEENNDKILNSIDDKLIFYIKEIDSGKRNIYQTFKNNKFKRHLNFSLLLIYYIIQSEYYFRHYKNSELFNWKKFYDKALTKTDDSIDMKISEL